MADMTPERAIEEAPNTEADRLAYESWRLAGIPFKQARLTERFKAVSALIHQSLAEVAALRAELAEAKELLAKVRHEPSSAFINACDTDCLACARDARWPKKETT